MTVPYVPAAADDGTYVPGTWTGGGATGPIGGWTMAGYGDSLTDLAHPGYLAGITAPFVVTNKGVNNEFGFNAGWPRLAADAPTMVQTCVVAMWGTNDLAVSHGFPDPVWDATVFTPFKSTCLTAVAALVSRGIPLILMVPPPFAFDDAIYTARRAQIKAFYQASLPSIPLIDLSGIDPATYLLGDGVHFNSAGIAYVAGLVQAKMLSIGVGSLGGLRFTGFPVQSATRGTQTVYNATETYAPFIYSGSGRSAQKATFLLSFLVNLPANGTWNVYLSPTIDPAAFSAGNPPSTAWTRVGTLADNGPAGVRQIPLDGALMARRYRDTRWRGKFALALEYTGVGIPTVSLVERGTTLPTLTVEPYPAFTGFEGHVEAQSRADRCPRCGIPSLRETWAVDGYSKTFVCPDCWDPADPLWNRRTPRPVRPGINDVG